MMKVWFLVQFEVYLVRFVRVSDWIQSLADATNRQEKIYGFEVIQDAVDQFDG